MARPEAISVPTQPPAGSGVSGCANCHPPRTERPAVRCSAHRVTRPAPAGAPLKSRQQTRWEMDDLGGTGTKGPSLVPTISGARGHRAVRAVAGAECE